MVSTKVSQRNTPSCNRGERELTDSNALGLNCKLKISDYRCDHEIKL